MNDVQVRPGADLPWAIDVQGLTKRYGQRTVVADLALRVRPGRICGFLGPNGSGKTTTIRMLCGLLRPDAGEGTCLGHDIRRETDRIKREVGYMTQRFSYWEDLSIRENLEFVARVYEVPDPKAKVDETLARLGLVARQHQLAGELSGGWKQRLALAACMLHAPRLLLLDEPTAGVDPQARRDFWEEIHRLSETGLTVLVSTHYMDEAERCDRIVYINLGKIIAQGTVSDVIEQSGLITFVIEGRDVRHLLSRLGGRPGVEHVAFFGAVLHISGHERKALEEALNPLRAEGYDIRESAPSLEDVFIHLQGVKAAA